MTDRGETLPDGARSARDRSETGHWLPHVPVGVPGEPTRLVLGDDQTRIRAEAEVELDVTRATVGPYAIHSVLGSGGMGVVYEAWDEELKRSIALKLIHERLAGDQEIYQRFEAEAQVTSQLRHPAIVPVYALGRTDTGELYYTMQKVQGKTLTNLVQVDLQRPEAEPDDLHADSSSEVPLERWTRFRVLQAFVLVCRAMAYAHSRGVVHRDLKPDNLMVGRFGQVYIMDWGVAKVLPNNSVRTSTLPPELMIFPDRSIEISSGAGTKVGAVLGTPAFMAPEQAGGSRRVGPQADVYSLGGILYFVLTGQPPHMGSPTEVLQKVSLGLPPRRPGSVKEGIPHDLELICMRALTYEARKRTESADELADMIEGYLEGRPLHLVQRKRDSGFLRSYSSRVYRKPSLTVDIVPLVETQAGPEVLLVKRTKEPFAGCWALPGSFIQLDETLHETALRVLEEKVGKGTKGALAQLAVWDEPGRDPRARVVTVGYLCRLAQWDTEATARQRELAWYSLGPKGELSPVDEGDDPDPKLAFDHAKILLAALERLDQLRS